MAAKRIYKWAAWIWLLLLLCVAIAILSPFGLWWVPLAVVGGFVVLAITLFAISIITEY